MALFEFKLSDSQFKQLLTLEREKLAVSKEIRDTLQVLVASTTEGFASVGKAISDLQTPDLPPGEGDDSPVEGRLMARYILNEDAVAANPGPKTFTIIGTGFKSRAGTPVGAQDIDLDIELIGENMTASISGQRLSEDSKSVLADVTIEGNAQQPTAELAVLKYSARNRDTDAEVAADTDEFETGPGEASIGTIDSPVPLNESISSPGGEAGGTTGGETGASETGTTGTTGTTPGGGV